MVGYHHYHLDKNWQIYGHGWNTVCPRSSYPFYFILSCCIIWVTTSWTYSINIADIECMFERRVYYNNILLKYHGLYAYLVRHFCTCLYHKKFVFSNFGFGKDIRKRYFHIYVPLQTWNFVKGNKTQVIIINFVSLKANICSCIWVQAVTGESWYVLVGDNVLQARYVQPSGTLKVRVVTEVKDRVVTGVNDRLNMGVKNRVAMGSETGWSRGSKAGWSRG